MNLYAVLVSVFPTHLPYLSLFLWSFLFSIFSLHLLIHLVQKLDSLSERIISLAFDVISRVLETGPVSCSVVFTVKSFSFAWLVCCSSTWLWCLIFLLVLSPSCFFLFLRIYLDPWFSRNLLLWLLWSLQAKLYYYHMK